MTPQDAPPRLFDETIRPARARRAAQAAGRADFLRARVAEDLAERLAGISRPFPRALILGSCGGRVAEALRGRVGADRLAQAEPTEAGAAEAAARAPFAETVVADGAAAFGEGAFDLVISGLALHRENDPVGQLVQLRRALAPDGFAIAALFAGRSLQELRACLAEAESAREGGLSPRVAPMADIRDLGGLLQRAGFAMPAADADRLTIRYADAFALMRDLRAMGEANPLSGRRRGFTRRGTLLEAAARYRDAYGDAEGRIPATVEIVWLAGWAPGPDQPTPKRPGSATARLADALGATERSAGVKAGG